LAQAREGRINFAFGAGLQDVNLNAHAASPYGQKIETVEKTVSRPFPA
jgi:hypothetical protein